MTLHSSTFFDAYFSDFTNYIQCNLSKEVGTEIHLASKALLATFEPYPAATLRQVFRRINTAPA